ncbi:MAG: hypothetical protein ACRCW2_12550 [Cellulosilyticaceae bacterium]
MKTKKMCVGIGSLSMVTLFVVLCLTIFAILALITVDRDYKLTQKTTQSVLDFYEADAAAEQKLATIDAVLIAAQRQGMALANEGHLAQVVEQLEQLAKVERLGQGASWKLRISYEEPLQTHQVLVVVLEVVPGEWEAATRYHIIEWALKTNEHWEQELVQPEFEEITLE